MLFLCYLYSNLLLSVEKFLVHWSDSRASGLNLVYLVLFSCFEYCLEVRSLQNPAEVVQLDGAAGTNEVVIESYKEAIKLKSAKGTDTDTAQLYLECKFHVVEKIRRLISSLLPDLYDLY